MLSHWVLHRRLSHGAGHLRHGWLAHVARHLLAGRSASHSRVPHGVGASVLELEELHDLGHGVHELGLLEQVRDVRVLLHVVLEVSLIVLLFLVLLAVLLDLVVVDVQLLVVELLGAQCVLGVGCRLGALVANESVDGLLVVWEHFDGFDISSLLEELGELFKGGVGGEVLDVEIASLLRVLVADHVLLFLDFSVCFGEGLLHVEDVLVIDSLFVQLLYGIDGALEAGFVAVGLVADEGEGASLVLLSHD